MEEDSNTSRSDGTRIAIVNVVGSLTTFKSTFYLSWLSYSYKLVKMLSVCLCLSVWMLTGMAQFVTAKHRDL